jgi:hypothetical protein
VPAGHVHSEWHLDLEAPFLHCLVFLQRARDWRIEIRNEIAVCFGGLTRLTLEQKDDLTREIVDASKQ